MAVEPALAAQYQEIRKLSQTIGSLAPEHATPLFLHRVEAMFAPPSLQNTSWRRAAMAACVSAVLASGATWLALRPAPADGAVASVLSAHIRGLASPQPFDIASSDRHNVKPWFDGRLAFSPLVVDLAAQGFPLAGGRMDAVDGQLAATMIYHYQQHTVTLTQARTAPQAARSTAMGEQSRDGYIIMQFQRGDLTNWLVTDLPPLQARNFIAAWKAAADSI